jgi:hypothetical protein
MLIPRTTSLYPELDPGFLANLILTMPAVDVSPIANSHAAVAREVQKAYAEVERESPPLPGERYHGSVPVSIHDTKDYAGVTRFGRVYRVGGIDVEAEEVGISRYVPLHKVKRVAKHELRHVKAEKLLMFADVPEHLARLVIEAYAEYDGIMHGTREEAREIEHTTPYPVMVKFARYVDNYYQSECTGRKGFAAFVNDIYKTKSMRAALQNLGRNIRNRTIN